MRQLIFAVSFVVLLFSMGNAPEWVTIASGLMVVLTGMTIILDRERDKDDDTRRYYRD